MATEPFKAEVEAIGTVLQQLEPLPAPARQRVIDYVLKALDISSARLAATDELPTPPVTDVGPSNDSPSDRMLDIRSFHDEKQPKSAIEMAAIVGYYLGELAPEEERKDAIVTADLEKYFKNARYPLPSKMRDILGNAAAAGYFDLAGRGRYRLNPVGHNLVVHNLPSGDANGPRRRTAKKSATKKTAAKKTATKKTATKKTAP